MRSRSTSIAAAVTIVIIVIAAALILSITLQAAVTTDSTHNEQNPMYVAPLHSLSVRLNESATENSLTLSVTSAMNSTDPQARSAWETYSDTYAPLNPTEGNKYVIVNVSVASARNDSAPFRYTDSVLVGNDGRSYFANYAVGNASCTASIAADQLKADSTCDVYIAFSLPNSVMPEQFVYESTNPAVIVTLT